MAGITQRMVDLHHPLCLDENLTFWTLPSTPEFSELNSSPPPEVHHSFTTGAREEDFAGLAPGLGGKVSWLFPLLFCFLASFRSRLRCP